MSRLRSLASFRKPRPRASCTMGWTLPSVVSSETDFSAASASVSMPKRPFSASLVHNTLPRSDSLTYTGGSAARTVGAVRSSTRPGNKRHPFIALLGGVADDDDRHRQRARLVAGFGLAHHPHAHQVALRVVLDGGRFARA